ncbi:hypothetical protein JCM11491_002506 [Sporobolomyces phaffii]
MERDGTERAMEGRPHDTAVRTPPRTSRAISTFAWDDAFATTALPDLTFSFQPKPLRLVRASGLSLPVEEREEDVEEEGTESCVLDDEDPFELEMGPDRDDGSEGASEEELDDMGDCQIIGARREHIGRLVELEQEEDDCDAHERRDGPIDDVPSPHAQVDCDSSRHTSEESEDRDLGIEPDLRCNSRIVQSMDFPAPPTLANARTEVSIGGSSSKTLVDDKAGPGQVEKWLKHVAEESEGKERRTVVEWRSRGEADGLRRAREGRLSRLKRFARTKRGRWTLGVLGALVSITVLIVAAVASSRKKEDGKVELWLNSTCLALGGNSIAQAFLDVAERASSTWSPSIDPSRLAYTLNHYVYRSNPSTSVCASQVALLSFPSLARHPNRLSFAQSALVHTLALSESNATTFRFHTFISSLALPAELGDDRAKRRNSNFQIMSGGFVWDFGTMERIVSSRTWRDVTRPSEDETRRMNGRTRGLDRIVPYAFASSAQRGRALRNYWTDDLGMDEDDLERFRQVVRESPVLVPISREEERTVRARIDNEDDAVEVVQGIGCREGLSPEVRNRVNDIENGVFGLDSISISNSNQTCANRPTYGIVNLFHLASPFPSSITLERPRLPLGSLVLSQNISARSTLNAGEALSAGPSSLPLRPLTSPLPSPFAPFTVERFGLFDQFDHVILEYLASMETETAQLVARFLLSRPTSPPSSTSPLSRRSEGLASLPLLEVQVWGGVRWNDVEELRSAG